MLVRIRLIVKVHGQLVKVHDGCPWVKSPENHPNLLVYHFEVVDKHHVHVHLVLPAGMETQNHGYGTPAINGCF